MRLSSFLIQAGKMDDSIQLLENGLAYHEQDPEYIKLYLQTMLMLRRDDEIRAYATARLGSTRKANPTLADRMAAFVSAQVFEAHGQFTRTLEILNNYEIANTGEGSILIAKILWKCGRRAESVQLLMNFINNNPALKADGVLHQLCEYLHELGRDNEAIIYSLMLCNRNPDLSQARIELINCYERTGNKDKATRETDSYIRQFSTNPEALLFLADHAIATGDRVTANKVYIAAGERGYDMGIFGMLMIEAHLTGKDYAGASASCQYVIDEKPRWIDRYIAQFNFLRAASARGLRQEATAELHFARVLDSKLTGNELFSMGRRLHNLGMDRDALRLLEHAAVIDPKNEDIYALMVEINIDNDLDTDFIVNINHLLDLRRPSYELLERARARMTSDHFIFSANRENVIQRMDKALEERRQIDGINLELPAALRARPVSSDPAFQLPAMRK
jgi:tetratricopeptide (TPR) repeat protein